MAFIQFKLDRSIDQSRGIFNKYIYETSDDTIANVLASGYFSASRFIALDGPDSNSEGWIGGLVECQCADGYLLGEVQSNGSTLTNITSGDGGITDLVVINTASDFPDAVGGVIELVTTPGAAITYLIAAVTIDVGSDRFTITGGEIVIRGVHRTASGITSSTTGTMFTTVNSAFFPEFISFTCAAGQFLDFTNPLAGIKSFVNQNLIIRDCNSLGTISGAFVSSFRTFTLVAAQTSGFLWTGTGNGQINMSSCLALSWAGTLFDLGTATFSLISISPNNRFLSPSGTTILSGATGSANLTATGRGLVESNIFNGLGTALDGIDTMDLKWQFSGNIFSDGTTLNSRQLVDSFLTATETVTITTQGVYVAVGGTNWATDISDRFTVSTAGIITYIGLNNIEVEITAFSTVEKVGGAGNKICSKIAINGTVQDKTIGCTENATPTGVTSAGLFTISTSDTIQLFVANEDSTSNVIVDESNIIIKGG